MAILTKKELRETYWINGLSPTQIAIKYDYPETKDVMDELKKYQIPVRPIDISKELFEIGLQDDLETRIRGSQLASDGAEVITEPVNVFDYRQFQFNISLNEVGTATGSTVTITCQFAVDKTITANTRWYDYEEGPWAFPVESDTTLPRNFSITGICLAARYIRLVFTAAVGTTLDSTNYFAINEIHGGFV